MSKPESRGPGRAPLPAVRVNAFFHPLGRTGSVTVAANRAQLRRTTLYQRRQEDDAFAGRWARALDLGVERLQDNALNLTMNRARDGSGRAGGFDTSAIRACVEKPFGTVRRTRHKGLARFGNPAKRRRLHEHLAHLNLDNSCPENRSPMVHAWRTTRTPRTTPDNAEHPLSFLACLKGPGYRRFSWVVLERTRFEAIERDLVSEIIWTASVLSAG